MSPEDPAQEGEDLIYPVWTHRSDREPFEADGQTLPETGCSSQKLFFGRTVEVRKAIQQMLSSSMRSVRFGVVRCATALRCVRLFLIDMRRLFGFTLWCLVEFPSSLSESYYGTTVEWKL